MWVKDRPVVEYVDLSLYGHQGRLLWHKRRTLALPVVFDSERHRGGSAIAAARLARRVQNETFGHRGHKYDPLYRARRLLTKAYERLDEKGETKLAGLLRAKDSSCRSCPSSLTNCSATAGSVISVVRADDFLGVPGRLHLAVGCPVTVRCRPTRCSSAATRLP